MIDFRRSSHGHLNFIHCAVDSSRVSCFPVSACSNDLHDNCCVCRDFHLLTNAFAYSYEDFIAIEMA